MYIRDDCPLPPDSSIYAYLRVSGEDQAERGTPIASRRQELERYIQKGASPYDPGGKASGPGALDGC